MYMYTCELGGATPLAREKTRTRVGVRSQNRSVGGKPEAYTPEENAVLRAALRRMRELEELTQAGVGAIIGVEQQNAGRLLAAGSKVGMGRATANRLARHIGFRDAEHLLLETGVLAEMQLPPPARSSMGVTWTERDRAVRLAPTLGYDLAAVEAVVARFTDDTSRHRPMKWWFDKFFAEERDRAETPPTVVPAAPASSVPSRRKPRKRASG